MTVLPIDSIEQEFKQALKQSHLIVEAETGSGKSTRLPLWSMEQGRVLVVEPRRIACTSLAHFVAHGLGEKVGESVGYAIKLENCYTEASNVVFVTPGVALRWYAEDCLKNFDVVIVDEFHERRWDTDLLVSMLKRNQTHKTVITSATIEGQKLADYFDAERLVAQGRVFDVAVQHHRNDSRQLPDARHLETRVKSAIEPLLDELAADILVFVPGRKEIQQVVSSLKLLAEQYDLILAPLHASVTEQQRSVAMSVQDKRKVVIATNVAETSLTIPNIAVVVDSGLERRNVQRNGQTTLMLTHISKASAAQRSGRAGRVMAGTCIRLYGEHAALDLVTPPELQRESIVEPMLAAATCGLALNDLEFIDAIPEKSLQAAKEQLVQLGAIDDIGITEHGRKLYPLPIDTIYADLVTKMPSRALKEVMIDLTAALCATGKLFQITSNEELLMKLDLEEPLGCDASILIGLVRGKQYTGLTVDQDCLREAQGLSEQMRSVFELPSLEVASRYQRDELIKQIIQANNALLYVRRERRRDAFGNGFVEVLLGRQNRIKPKTEAGLVLATHSLPGRGVKQTMTLATLLLPVDITQLKELNVGEWVSGETIETDEGLQHCEHLMYAGRKLTERRIAPEGDVALKAIAKSIIEGAIFPTLAEQLTERMLHWKLYVELGLSDQTGPVDEVSLESWIAEQLSMLGVSSFEDLELIDERDFVFNGVPDWEYSDFAAKYPLVIQLSGLRLTVEYFGKGKLIHVHFHSGSRKDDPKRKELPAWSGWKVKYKKASRVLDLR